MLRIRKEALAKKNDLDLSLRPSSLLNNAYLENL